MIDDTADHSGLNASSVQVIDEATIESITAPRKINAEGLTGVALPEGTIIEGPITQIKLTSGVVECHEIR